MHALISLSRCLTRAVTGSSVPHELLVIELQHVSSCSASMFDYTEQICAGIKTMNQNLGYIFEMILAICMFLFWGSCLNRKILAVHLNVCSLKNPTISQNPQHFWLDYNKTYIKESQRLQYLHCWLINRVLTLEVLAVNGVPGWDIKHKTDK